MTQVAHALDNSHNMTDLEFADFVASISKRLTKSKTQLCMDKYWSLFSGLILGVETVVSDVVPTAGTNGKKTYYNPFFVTPMTNSQERFLIMHEVMHCALEHVAPSRFQDRDRQVYNIACDVVINYVLTDGTEWRPTIVTEMGGIYDAELYKEGDGNADKIYKILMDRKSKEPDPGRGRGRGKGKGKGGTGQGQGTGKGKDGTGQGQGPGNNNGNGGTDNEPQSWDDCTFDPIDHDEEFEVKVQIKEALARARKSENFGRMSASLQRLIEELDIDKPKWTEILDNYMASDNVERSWARPSSRFASQGIYLPARGGKSVGCVVVCLDVSGSVGQEELNLRAAEIYSIVENYTPKKLVVISHDTKAYLVDECDQGEDPDMAKVKGGGGTHFVPALTMAAEYEPDVCIMLTDLGGPCGTEPDFPVVWASTHRDDAPFGKVILIDA